MKLIIVLFLVGIIYGCQNVAMHASQTDGKDKSKIMLNDNNGENYSPEINPENFVKIINHPYLKLMSGNSWRYEGENEDGNKEKSLVEVTPFAKIILGVNATVVRDRVWINDVLVEDTYDWFAQDKQGNVWYFGEGVDNYENAKLADHNGAWEAGKFGARPGIIMKANPQAGDKYRQEFLKGEAEDMGEVLSVNETLGTRLGSYKNCLKIKDWTPMEPNVVEHKYYCREAGSVVLKKKVAGGTGQLELVEFRN